MVMNRLSKIISILILSFVLIFILTSNSINCSAGTNNSNLITDAEEAGENVTATKRATDDGAAILSLALVAGIIVPSLFMIAILVVLWYHKKDKDQDLRKNLSGGSSTTKPGEEIFQPQATLSNSSGLITPPEYQFPYPSDFDRPPGQTGDEQLIVQNYIVSESPQGSLPFEYGLYDNLSSRLK
jgi:hypothetical protein